MDNEVFKIYKTVCNGKRIYEVSNLGRVKLNGEIVEPHMQGNYLSIASFYIHRAVAELFIPNPENKPCVDHINTDRADNRAENLRWVTQAENNRNPLTRKHASEVRQGIILIFSADRNRKISEALKGKPKSDEHKQNISKARKGKPGYFKGKLLSEEHRSKIGASKKGRHWKLVDGKRIWYD